MERTVPQRAAEAVAVAYNASLKAGNSVLVLSNGVIYRVGPDMMRVKVKVASTGVRIQKGTKFKIK